MKSIKLPLPICCLVFLAMASFASAALRDGLISAWTFDDGTATDVVGNNDGEVNGGVEVVDGKLGKALSFLGTDGFVRVPHDASMEAIKDGFTVSIWINLRAEEGRAGFVFKGKMIGWAGPYSFRIMLAGGSAQQQWGVSNAGGAVEHVSIDVSMVGVWLFLCLTADGTKRTCYVAQEDNKYEVEIPQGPWSNNPDACAAPYLTTPGFPIEMGVGRGIEGVVGNDHFLDGLIDEVYLWDRALSDEEIQQLAKEIRPEGFFPVEPSGKIATLWGTIKEMR